MAITPTPASQPIVKTQIADISTQYTTNDLIIDVLNNFDDPSTTGKAVRFRFYDGDRLAGGIVEVILFDQADTGASITVQNFLNYVSSNAYNNTLIHRSPFRDNGNKFVIQGGGFTVTDNVSLEDFVINSFSQIPTNAPIKNEYSDQRENIVGTIAMAKLGNDPNSATSQWFFNMDDNTQILNQNQNGGFTTFGQVINDSSLTVTQEIGKVSTARIADVNVINVGITRFQDLPLFITVAEDLDNPNDFVRLVGVEQFQLPELTFSLVSNSNPDLVNVSFNGQQMVLDYLNNVDGSAEITVKATNTFGQTIQDTFIVNVESNNESIDRLSLLNTPLNRFRNLQIQGTYLFATEGESVSIRENYSNVFDEEGPAFKVALQKTDDDLVQFNRFANKQVQGTYLYANEEESISIRQNYSNVFEEEGIAFYAFGADQGIGEDYYRMANTQVQGTYLFVGQQERDQILADPNLNQIFRDEGVAFEVAPV